MKKENLNLENYRKQLIFLSNEDIKLNSIIDQKINL